MKRLVAVLAVAALLGGPALAAREAPDRVQAPRNGAELGSRLAAGPFVVLGTVIRVGAKERLRIDRAYRGDDLAPVVRVDSRQANATRTIDAPTFEMRRDEKAVFVLEPARDFRDDLRAADILQPAAGFRSKIPLPAEGAPALLEAVEKLVHYQDSPQRGVVEAELVEWLEGPNPWLVDFAVDQAARYGLARGRWIPGLLTLTRGADPWHRARAVEALGAALERERRRGRTRTRRRSAVAAEETSDAVRTGREAIIRLARTDEEADVRIAAIRVVPGAGIPGAARVLRAISKEDPDHDVRYEAAASLRRLGETASGRSPSAQR